jgi:alpha-glucosidase
LLPYLYTQLEETSRSGLPVMRPLWLEYPNDPAIYDVADAYLLGPDLLVAPKLVAGAARYRVVLPAADWYDLQTLELVSGGAREVQAPTGDSVRLYVRAGAIIAEAPVVMSTDEKPNGPLTVNVWPGPRCSGSLYLDDGKSFAFRSGQLLRMSYRCEAAADHVTVEATSAGGFSPWWREQRLVVHAVPRAPKSVARNGAELPHAYDAARHTLVVPLREPGSFVVQVSW